MVLSQPLETILMWSSVESGSIYCAAIAVYLISMTDTYVAYVQGWGGSNLSLPSLY